MILQSRLHYIFTDATAEIVPWAQYMAHTIPRMVQYRMIEQPARLEIPDLFSQRAATEEDMDSYQEPRNS